MIEWYPDGCYYIEWYPSNYDPYDIEEDEDEEEEE